jgi:hypothetical protein
MLSFLELSTGDLDVPCGVDEEQDCKMARDIRSRADLRKQ